MYLCYKCKADVMQKYLKEFFSIKFKLLPLLWYFNKTMSVLCEVITSQECGFCSDPGHNLLFINRNYNIIYENL